MRVYAADDRDRDRLARLTRWLLVRDPQDRPGRRHGGIGGRARDAGHGGGGPSGGRASPNPSSPTPSPAGRGRRGPWWPGSTWAANASTCSRRRRLARRRSPICGTACRCLHQHRLAHRQLRRDNITVDGSDRAWLTGLVLAELGATDRQLATDVAELLASLAVQIGVDRAVASAVAGLGAPTVARGRRLPAAPGGVRSHPGDGPGLRPQRGPSPCRVGWRRLRPGGRPSLYADLRTAVAQATGEPPVKPEQLARFTWKKGA